MHTISILHTAGCVGAPEAEKLARSLAASRHDVKVEVVLVADEEQAVALGFRGSPTVLVDGEDIEPDSGISLGTMAWRRYLVPGQGARSHPTEPQLIEALGRGATMSRLDTLLDRAVATLPGHLRDHVVVSGSAPMVLAGLKPDVGDLDLLVSEETFEDLVTAGFQADENQLGYLHIVLADGVEAIRSTVASEGGR